MGDMADWIIEQGFYEYYEGQGREEYGNEALYPFGGLKSCSYCGASGLHWEFNWNLGRYMLADDKCFHDCDDYKKNKLREMRARISNE